jgi:hypothetical protein
MNDNSVSAVVNTAKREFLLSIPHLHGNARRRALAKWRRENEPGWKDRVNQRGRQHRKKDKAKEKYRAWEAEYRRRPEVRIKRALRRRLQNAVECQQTIRRFKTRDTIGCSAAQLRQWIEGQWKRGMSWENYGEKWQIDHIVPISKFKLSDPAEQKKANHFTNLQPLWNPANQAKRDKIVAAQTGLLLVA